MKAFLKTLIGDVLTVSLVAMVMGTELLLIASGRPEWSALTAPSLVLGGIVWLAARYRRP